MVTGGGSGFVESNIPVVNGQTTLLVVHTTFLAGKDRVELFVNPAPGDPPTVAEPPAAGTERFEPPTAAEPAVVPTREPDDSGV